MIRLLLAFAAALMLAGAVDAAQRTFVATSGSDASASCSLTSPCRSFGKAITVTDPAGEIIVLDSGGYGRVTIDRSVSIIAPPGIYAGVSVFAGTNGVDINTPGVKVTLRGLFINGQGGNLGINFSAGAELHVDGCVISDMGTHGLFAGAGGIYVHDTLIRNNGGSGMTVAGASGHVDGTRLEANGADGIFIVGTGRLLVRHSLIAGNGDRGITVTAGPLTRVDIESTTISANAQNGVWLLSSPTDKAEVTMTRSVVARNGAAGTFDGVGAIDNVHLSITNSAVTGNYGEGIFAGSGATVVVSNNIVTKNALHGFLNIGSTFKSRGDNTVEDNFAGASSGVITPIGGL